MFDYLIVGCGLSGATCSRILADKGEKVLIIDQRNHIAGNVYDEYNDANVLVHIYGPHIFHTKFKDVWNYLSRFTQWREYQHRVKAFVNGMLVPMPINLDTINLLYGTNFTEKNIETDFYSLLRSKDVQVKNSADMVICKVGRELYTLFFQNYTRKQWGIDAEDLDKEVTARIPIRYNRDDRYFTDSYQGMPKFGYTKMIKEMLDHPGIQVMLNAKYQDMAKEVQYARVIYTGPIDEFFDYRYGKLSYRSIKFDFETINDEYYQSAAVINYPNDYDYTRITEFKYMTGQNCRHSTIVKEYPTDSGEPYYPIPRPENKQLYNRYAAEAEKLTNTFFLGRLGLYKYANMDIVVKDAMDLVQDIS
jgi:UDP-galactopyranose mutase